MIFLKTSHAKPGGGVSDGGQPVPLRFANELPVAADVYWDDAQTESQRLFAVAPGETKTVDGLISHEFVWREQRTMQCAIPGLARRA